MGIRPTSKKALFELLSSGLLSRQREYVFRMLYHYGPATANELYEHMRESRSKNAGNVTTRLSELRTMQCVDEVDKRECRITGKTCIVWDVNGNQPIPYYKPKGKSKNALQKEVRFLRARVNRLKKLAVLKK